MKKSSISLFLLASSFCMAMEQKHSENYKHQYNSEYNAIEETTKDLSSQFSKIRVAIELIQSETNKDLDQDILNARIEAIRDFVIGYPNKFKK